MAAQSLLAKLGMRAAVLGSVASLAIAAPLAAGDVSMGAHTDASRIGWFFDRTPGAEKTGHVVMGTEILSVGVAAVTSTVKVNTPASTALTAGLNVGQGIAPAAPVNGDFWITATGAFARIAGVTQQLDDATGITGTLVAGRVPFASGAQTLTDDDHFLYSTSVGFQVWRGSFDNAVVIGKNAGLGIGPADSADSCTFVGNDAGRSMVVGGTNNTYVGSGVGYTDLSSVENVGVGVNALGGGAAIGIGNVAIGVQALNQTSGGFGNNTAIGYYAGANNSTGNYNIFLGALAGDSTSVTASSRFVVGSNSAVISEVWVGGSGETNSTPQAYTINGTGGSGANIAGGNITLAGGRSTGSATGGSAIISTSPADGAGTTLNASIDRLTVAGDGGVSWTGITTANSPAVSAANNGTIFYDRTLQQFRVSTNTGAYGNLTVNGITGTLVAGRVPFASAPTVLTDSNTFTYAAASGLVVNLTGIAPPALPTGTGLNVVVGNANAAVTRAMLGTYMGTGGGFASYSGRSARGSISVPTAVQSGDEMTHFAAWGYGATGFSSAARAYLTMFAAENWTDTAQGTRIGFFNTAPGGAVTTEKMRIWGDGGVQIGGPFTSSPGITSFAMTQGVTTTGSPTAFRVTGAANTTLTATVEAIDVDFALNRTVQFSTGAITTQRAVLIRAPTYAFVGASTISNASTLEITGPPIAGTNATLTASGLYALKVTSGRILVAAGTAALPTITFTETGNDTGLFSVADGSVGITTNGGLKYTFANALLTSTNVINGPVGTAAAPTYSFTGDTNTGMFQGGADIIGFTVNGVLSTSIRTTSTQALANLNVAPAAVASGSSCAFRVFVPGDTGQTASVEANSVLIDLGSTKQFATGALTNQRAFRIVAPTYAFVGASTITNAATFSIGDAPAAGANATLTNSMALWVQAGMARFDGTAAIAAGAVGTPSLFFFGDSNTGIYSSAADTFDVTAGGTNTLRVTATTVTVTGKLTVTGLIDPTGVEFSAVAANPGGVAARTIWFNSSDANKFYVGATPGALGGAVTASGITMSTARLLGRTTAATGAIEEISVGTGLSLAAGSLTCTVTAGITGTLVSGRVPFANGVSSVTDNTAMTFSVANGFSVNRAGATNNETFGRNAGNNTIVGPNITILGNGAGAIITDGEELVIIGRNAGAAVVDAYESVLIGNGVASEAGGDYFYESVAIGHLAYRKGTNGTNQGTDVCVGALSLPQSGGDNVAIGYNAGGDVTGGYGNVMIGKFSTTNANTTGCTLLGNDSNSSYNNCLALGFAAQSWGVNQCIIGSQETYYNDFFIGSGYYNATVLPQDVNFQVSRGQGNNSNGSNLRIKAGDSTGIGVGGELSFWTANTSLVLGPTPNLQLQRLTVRRDGGIAWTGITTANQPSLSAANNGTIFYDSTLQAFRYSANGSAYANLVGGGGGITGTLVSGRVPFANGVSSLTDSAFMTFDATTGFAVNMAATGVGNITIGNSNGGWTITSGTLNVIVGDMDIGTTLTTGVRNVFIGVDAGCRSLPGASETTAVGFQAGLFCGSEQTFIGAYAGLNDTTASSNVGVGFRSLYTNISGLGNTAVGYQALENYIADNSTAVGYRALKACDGGMANTAVGNSALTAITNGTRNAAFGYEAGSSGVLADDMTAIGYNALALATGAGDTAVGSLAGGAIVGGGNVALGYNAMHGSGVPANNTINNSVAIGYQTLANVSTGSEIVAIGGYAAQFLTTSSRVTAVGRDALQSATSGASDTTAIGFQALFLCSGANNTAIGSTAANVLTTGSNNVFLGAFAGDSTANTASNRFVVGSNNSPIYDVFIGQGETNAGATAVTFHVTGGDGTNIAGGSFRVAGGRGTGTGTGGSVIISTAPAGGTGTTPNALVDRLTVDSAGVVTVTSAAVDSFVVTGGMTIAKQARFAQIAGTTVDGDLWHDSTQNALQTYTSGIEQTLSGCIFTQTATRTIANTVTETSLLSTGVGTLTLPANFFVDGKTIRLTLSGNLGDTGTPTVRLRLKYGATTLIDSGATTFTALGGAEEWRAVCDITCRSSGVGGVVASDIWFMYDTTTGSATLNALDIPAATAALDTTASGALDLTFEWGTAAAANTISTLLATVEVLN